MRIRLLLGSLAAIASISLPVYNKLAESLGEPHAAPVVAEVRGDDETGGEEHSGEAHGEEGATGEHHAKHKIVVTSPVANDVVLTQQYVCQIHSCRHIEVCALEGGYLQDIAVREGQAVRQGDVMFKILPTLYEAKRDADLRKRNLQR